MKSGLDMKLFALVVIVSLRAHRAYLFNENKILDNKYD